MPAVKPTSNSWFAAVAVVLVLLPIDLWATALTAQAIVYGSPSWSDVLTYVVAVGIALGNDNPTPRSPLYLQNEAAAFLRTPVRTLEYWRGRGEGPRFIKLGKRVAYRFEDLESWLRQQTRTHTGDDAENIHRS